MSHTDIFTYLTVASGASELLFSAEDWIRIEFQLETAGPVAVGTKQNLSPVLSGKGILLPADGEPVRFIVPRGDRVYIAADAVNRVKVMIEPLPWIEQVLYRMDRMLNEWMRRLT
jgi:hypothetical protein